MVKTSVAEKLLHKTIMVRKIAAHFCNTTLNIENEAKKRIQSILGHVEGTTHKNNLQIDTILISCKEEAKPY